MYHHVYVMAVGGVDWQNANENRWMVYAGCIYAAEITDIVRNENLSNSFGFGAKIIFQVNDKWLNEMKWKN